MVNNEKKIPVTTTTQSEVINYNNTAQEHITMTSDKAKLILLKYLAKIKKKTAWVTPVSLFITLFLIPITSEFKKAFGVSAAAWLGVCYIAMVILFIWLLYTIWAWFKERTVTIDTIIEELKNNPQ